MEETLIKKSVFVVDDSDVLRRSLRKLVERSIGAVFSGETATLADAVALIKEKMPDIVILDINFPEGIGVDIISKIKKVSKKIKIIMFSNFDTEKLRSICADEGADYYFNKSSEIEKLIELLDNL